jgi:hypothetical protein
MDTNQLKAILEAEIDDAIGFIETETVSDRKYALQSYLRQPYGNEVEGKSSIVTGEVAEAIDGALPALVRIFTASDEVAQFDPVAAGDEPTAKQATDYCNYILLKDNDGVMIFHDWFKDALLQKNGIVKAYWEDKEDVTKEAYEGLSDDELAMLMSDKEVEVVEQDSQEFPVLDQMGMPAVGPDGMPMMYGIHNITVKKKMKSGRVQVENVPPEEFIISKKARKMADSPFVAHRRIISRGDLIAMGFDKDVVEGLPIGDTLTYNPERVIRYEQSEQPEDNQSLDPAMQDIEVYECYIRADMDDDGIAELRQVFYAGNEILSEEETDYVPFYSICPIPIPHKFFGQSFADRTTDIQLIKTTILRQMLDNLYLTNNARVVAIEGQVNLDDLLTSTAGGVIRAKSQGAVQQLTVQSIASQSFPMLEYLDQTAAKRTGVSDASQGLDPAILQNVTAAAVASMQQAGAGKIEMVARIFAETGVKDLFKGIMHLVTKYQNKDRIIRLRNEYIPIDPRTWATEYDISVNVGLGAGNRQEQMAMLSMIVQKQEQLLGAFGMANPYVSPAQYRNTLGRMVEAAGFKDSAEFYKAIPPEMDQQLQNPPPQQQQADPMAQAAMAKMQADIQASQAKAQADLQTQQAKAQADIQLAREKAAADLQLQREKFAAQMDFDRQKLVAELQMKQQEFEAEVQIKASKVAAGITSNVEIPG